ncbi:hypothetical protein ACFWSF_09560 [Streptomyces sp. NPDC058611]|uniref:hypothetical protein n=1 Tax=unclassified Streptomyces TaxID=2593676 RepID=UPI0036674B8C
MRTFTVEYHGSLTRAHGRYLARLEGECPHGRDHDGYPGYPDIRLILSDPETGVDALYCVRNTSVTEMAPDGKPLNIPARDGDLVQLDGSGPLVIFAGQQQPARRYGSDRHDEIEYYARSAGRWCIQTALRVLDGTPITRARYSSPQDRERQLLRIDQEDHITYLRDIRDHPDQPDYEREADDLERVMQRLEVLSL